MGLGYINAALALRCQQSHGLRDWIFWSGFKLSFPPFKAATWSYCWCHLNLLQGNETTHNQEPLKARMPCCPVLPAGGPNFKTLSFTRFSPPKSKEHESCQCSLSRTNRKTDRSWTILFTRIQMKPLGTPNSSVTRNNHSVHSNSCSPRILSVYTVS